MWRRTAVPQRRTIHLKLLPPPPRLTQPGLRELAAQTDLHILPQQPEENEQRQREEIHPEELNHDVTGFTNHQHHQCVQKTPKKLLTADAATLWCTYAHINSYLIICKWPLDWIVFTGDEIKPQKHACMTGKRPDCSDLITQELNICHKLHFFCAFTHQNLCPQDDRRKLSTKEEDCIH